MENLKNIPKYCINLEARIVRMAEARIQFYTNGFHGVKRFNAIRERPGWIGCRLSHLAIMRIEENTPTFMVFEDDVVFLPDAYENLEKAISQLPDDWDMLYMGCNPLQQLEKYSENLYILKNAYTTHAMIFNNPEMVKYIISKAIEMRKIDVFLAEEIMPKYKCFVTYPLVAAQANGESDICKHETQYFDTITRNFNKYTR